jgi:hypothetical protein
VSFHFVPLNEFYWSQIPDEARPRSCSDTKGIVALNELDQMEAACVLDTWSHNACQLHMFIKNPFVLKHGFQQEIANFVFGETSGRELMIGVTPADNATALKFNKHMGMDEQFRIPNGYAKGIDYVVTTMTKEDCRWFTHRKEAMNG